MEVFIFVSSLNFLLSKRGQLYNKLLKKFLALIILVFSTLKILEDYLSLMIDSIIDKINFKIYLKFFNNYL